MIFFEWPSEWSVGPKDLVGTTRLVTVVMTLSLWRSFLVSTDLKVAYAVKHFL